MYSSLIFDNAKYEIQPHTNNNCVHKNACINTGSK